MSIKTEDLTTLRSRLAVIPRLFGMLKKVSFVSQVMEFLQVEYWRFSEQVVFSHVLLMVSIFHFLLINIIDELLYFVLSPTGATSSREPSCGLGELAELWLIHSLSAKELGLQDWWKLWNAEIFTIFDLVRNAM